MTRLDCENRGFRCRKRGRRPAALTLGLMICAAGAPALAGPAKCKLGRMVEFPITMNRSAPEIVARINGTDVRLVVDSGAFYSTMDAGSASALGLRVYPAPPGFDAQGIGGDFTPSLTRAKEFTLPGLTLHDMEFLVGGSHVGGQAIGLLGRNILQVGDAEYDLANGVARLMKAEDCSDTVMAYWLRPGESYSVAIIMKAPQPGLKIGSHVVSKQGFQPPVAIEAYVNGVTVRAILDSGASASFLSVKAAARAGILIDSPGIIPAGVSTGVGRSTVRTYIAPVSTFKIGDEEIRNTRLRLGAADIPGIDMLIGADFFLSHHIYVANSQNKVYFSYNGGPVFNLADQQLSPSAANAPSAPSESKPPKEDASDYARRGAALRARQELNDALQAYNRACELAPDSADYFYERAILHTQLNQPGPALADLDRAIQIEPHEVTALLARVDYRIQSGDKAGAEADLDAANAVLSKEDYEHLTLANGYLRLDLLTRAIEQFDLWSMSHPQDVRWPAALEGKCMARALGNFDLPLARKDCDSALKDANKATQFYAEVAQARGLLLFRLGDYDKSIEDYDEALEIDPKSAFALFGRGIDKLRKQRVPDGQADITQAIALRADVADHFKRHGIAP